MRNPTRILGGGAALLVVALAGVGWLVGEALRGAEALTTERHVEVVSRFFDEIDRELSALVEREEARSFLEYRYFYVPNDNANPAEEAAVVQSPLSRPTEDPAVAGWFQIDPGGIVRTPREPGRNELALALQNGWCASPDQDAEVRDAVRAVASWAPPPPPPAEEEVEVPKAPVPVASFSTQVQQKLASSSNDLLFNRGAEQRQYRANQKVVTKETNLAAYEQDTRSAPLAPDLPVDVDVAPMTGVRVGDKLLLSRIVSSGDQQWRQGVVLRLPELERKLADAVFGARDLPGLELAWDDAPAPSARYTATHVFAPPFSSVRLAVGIAPVPELAASRSVVGLSAALVAALVLGAAALLWAIRAELEFAQRRSDFVAAVSHELKTPLTTIRMYAEMLRDGMVPDAAKQRDYHATITAESDRLSRLIANVLALARLERGGPPPAPEVGPLGPVVREALEIVRPHAASEGFTVGLEEGPDLPPVRFERDAVLQIVVNLVDNAVKFARSGDRTVRVVLARDGDRVALVVRDHGPGVPAGHLRHLFDPFFRGERELTRTTSGTGLGLALVRGLATGMGATVGARNHPDGGFEVRLAFG